MTRLKMSVMQTNFRRSIRYPRALAGPAVEENTPGRILTAAEVATVYAGLLLYIWRWHGPHPLVWIPILGFVILTHFLHRDTPGKMGILGHQARESARLILPLALVIYGVVVIWALLAHRLALPWPRNVALSRVAIYAIWCCFQQYLMQSYFYRRLMAVLRSPFLSAVAAALMFGGVHVPNLVLMVATTAGGFILSEVFARHPNIWPLALTQFLGGLLIAAVFPVSVTHQMRVGPGYYLWHRAATAS